MSNIQRFGRTAEPGEVLFTEGDTGETMFVIQKGRVRITKKIRGVEQQVAELSAGEFFGEMSILNNKPRTATATVIESAQLLAIDPRTFEGMIKANTEIAVRMIKKLAARLDDANDQIEGLHLRDANSRVVHVLIAAARTSPELVTGGVRVQLTVDEISTRTDLDAPRILAVLERMQRSGLIAVESTDSMVVPHPDKLEEFLDFLEM